MPPKLPVPYDKLTTIEADMLSQRSRASGLCDKHRRGVLTGEDDHVHPLVGYPPIVAVAARELAEEPLRLLATTAPPGANPPGALVVSVVFAASASGAPLDTLKAYIRSVPVLVVRAPTPTPEPDQDRTRLHRHDARSRPVVA
jgi:hypothetical protein